jgi:hypothetical protein
MRAGMTMRVSSDTALEFFCSVTNRLNSAIEFQKTTACLQGERAYIPEIDLVTLNCTSWGWPHKELGDGEIR